MSEMLWKGIPLEEYSKEKLIKIIQYLDNTIELLTKEHTRQLDFFIDLHRRKL